jgi:membrane protein YqaA with SNARE-associated domain
MCSRFLCCVCGLIRLNLWLFLLFLIGGLVQVVIFSFVVNFKFFP